ncbi:DUF3618 domain-containing protein [Sphaerisporangium perillae]|uniref:DUF3618 domain-containing protein n=1 Tax=Sphaerisporangium perillae TaxID=2935860 RepID=UPI00200BB6E1|nr:DUF3618 domain-containing protein [Sphaerisporangium perillae]
MTETDPIGAPERPTAGEVGLHRQEPGTATPESAGPSLNVPEVHVPPKPYVKPVVSHGRGDPLAGLSETTTVQAAAEPPSVHTVAESQKAPPRGRHDGKRGSEADRLRDDIVRTREELGRTVEALAHKVDVKSRAQQKMADTKAAAREKAAGVADRLRGVASHSARTATEKAGTTREAVPVRLKDVAGQVSTQARRRPAVVIAIGAATMVGAGLLNWAERRGTRTRSAARTSRATTRTARRTTRRHH